MYTENNPFERILKFKLQHGIAPIKEGTVPINGGIGYTTVDNMIIDIMILSPEDIVRWKGLGKNNIIKYSDLNDGSDYVNYIINIWNDTKESFDYKQYFKTELGKIIESKSGTCNLTLDDIENIK